MTLAFPILDAACSMMKNMATLEETMKLEKPNNV